MSKTNGESHVPSADDDEAAVLGSVILSADEGNSDQAVAFLDALNLSDFHDWRNRAVYEALRDIRHGGRIISSLLLDGELRRAGTKGESITGYALELPNKTTTLLNFPVHLESVREASWMRRALDDSRSIVEALESGKFTKSEFAELLARASEHASSDASSIEAVAISTLLRHVPGDPSELIRHRFLCRMGTLLLAGPAGVGKSSLAMQLSLSWALGSDCLGFSPTSPLKSLLIQAENDDGDLAEMRDGVADGMELNGPQREEAFAKVLVVREANLTGRGFFSSTVSPLLAKYRPDILWIDPVLAYLGGDVKSQEIVGPFLRNGLHPLLVKFNCAAVVLHHTNKPPSGVQKAEWAAGEFAYLGSGSAEFANYCRAVIALRSLGSHDVFDLQAGKRGARLRWKNLDDSTAYSKQLAHAREEGRIFWRPAEPDEIPKPKGAPQKGASADECRDLLPPEGLTKTAWELQAEEMLSLPKGTFRNRFNELRKTDRIFKSKIDGNWLKKGT